MSLTLGRSLQIQFLFAMFAVPSFGHGVDSCSAAFETQQTNVVQFRVRPSSAGSAAATEQNTLQSDSHVVPFLRKGHQLAEKEAPVSEQQASSQTVRLNLYDHLYRVDLLRAKMNLSLSEKLRQLAPSLGPNDWNIVYSEQMALDDLVTKLVYNENHVEFYETVYRTHQMLFDPAFLEHLRSVGVDTNFHPSRKPLKPFDVSLIGQLSLENSKMQRTRALFDEVARRDRRVGLEIAQTTLNAKVRRMAIEHLDKNMESSLWLLSWIRKSVDFKSVDRFQFDREAERLLVFIDSLDVTQSLRILQKSGSQSDRELGLKVEADLNRFRAILFSMRDQIRIAN